MTVSSKKFLWRPLGEHAEGFLAELASLDYAPRSRQAHWCLMKHLSRWLAAQGVSAGDLTGDVVERFVAERREQYSCLRSARALAPLLGYLRRCGVVPMAPSPSAMGATEVLVERFARYLATERGLAPATVTSYISQVRPFLARHAGTDDGQAAAWASLSPKQVGEFIASRAAGQRPSSLAVGLNALRCLLRWMWLEGIVPAALADTIGSVAPQSGTGVPKALNTDQVKDLLAALPVDGPVRLRDEAMLALMWRMGLRAGEVACLRLDDIDWRVGVVAVHGKGDRYAQTPLPTDVGVALVAYLREGRPVGGAHRQVFLAVDAPHRPLAPSAASDVVARTLARAGITGPGAAHRLRHTAGCRVLAGGGGLIEAGQLLRHTSAAATAIYAKSDLAALVVLARPWPAAVSR